uniref:Uncharacterized protein n=1 Tax=Aureoumbra lagunensis TaxID=44058 RepID=A0A7S3NMR6_9STRA
MRWCDSLLVKFFLSLTIREGSRFSIVLGLEKKEQVLRALLKEAGPRPRWLPEPKLSEILVTKKKDYDKSKIKLVSTAVGERWESSLSLLEQSYKTAGFDEILLWRKEELIDAANRLDHPNASTFLTSLAAPERHRPYCAAFKPLQLWIGMLSMNDDDYIMWSDSSRHHSTYIVENVQQAILQLKNNQKYSTDNVSMDSQLVQFKKDMLLNSAWKYTSWGQEYLHTNKNSILFPNSSTAVTSYHHRHEDSAYGLLHCPFDFRSQLYLSNAHAGNVDKYFRYISETEFFAYPTVLDSNILIKVSPFNRLLIWDWLSIALTQPDAWCSSRTSDQGPWAVLIQSRKLPLTNTCPFLDNCFYYTPNLRSAPYCQGVLITGVALAR